MFFVPREAIDKVLDACPEGQWRLLVALSRFGGLRCPSKHFALMWGDVDWANQLITVPSPMTEHHEGKAYRVIPLFPELRPHLEAAFDESKPGTKFVITRYRDASLNLRTNFLRIIKRAGLVPWPKLFHNLRSSRQTELADTLPAHVVCAWIGNSEAVAREHYLQITEDHFTKALQNPVQSGAELARFSSQAKTGQPVHFDSLQPLAAECVTTQNRLMPPQGLEPWTY